MFEYTVQQGDTLNAISNRLGFTDYREAGITSVPSGNFDLIRPGEKIKIGNYPVQQSTVSMRSEAVKNSETLDNKIAGVAGSQQTEDTQGGQGETVTVVRDRDNGDGTRTVTYSDGSTARVSVTTNQDGSESYKELSPQDEVLYDRDTGISEAENRAKKRVDYATETLDTLSRLVDTTANTLIESIKKTYGARIRLMEDTNRRIVNATRQTGIRTGRARYTQSTNAGIISDEEQKGLDRVAKLEGEMLGLISKAEQARNSDNLEVFNSLMKQINESDKTLRDEIESLHTIANDELKRMREADEAAIKAEETQLDVYTKKAESVAPAVMDAMQSFTSPEEQSQFIQEYARRSGIPVDVLLSAIEEAADEDQKRALDLENTRSLINTRQRNQALDEQKYRFNPSSDERAKVGKYLANNGDENDVKQAETDKDFFYYILGLAEEEEL